MARPRKKRGFRPIVVDDQAYRWRLNMHSGLIEVSLDGKHLQRLEIDFGWYDVWLHIKDRDTKEVFEPRIVTPHFVEQAIRFGCQYGWTPEIAAPSFGIVYREQKFALNCEEVS